MFIFSDAPKYSDANEKVKQVRDYIKTISGFKAVIIKEQTQNLGLAKSIIDGVTEVVNKFGKIIVLEDDIEVSPYFLKFMNEALIFFKNERKIWSVTGFSYPIKHKKLPDIFCFFAMSCWSWGTWADRWVYYDKNPDRYISLFTKKIIHRFDYYDSTEMFSQITANKTEVINTWAIFWYAIQFINNGFQIMPSKPLAKNIGMDGTGIHCGTTSIYNYNIYKNEIKMDFNNVLIEENKLATKLISNFLKKQKKKPSVINYVKKIIKRLLLKL